jgi:hypothetical protein
MAWWFIWTLVKFKSSDTLIQSSSNFIVKLQHRDMLEGCNGATQKIPFHIVHSFFLKELSPHEYISLSQQRWSQQTKAPPGLTSKNP